MVGQQTKYSEMVKGKQHDQTFDETLEFVLAAGLCHVLHLASCIILHPTCALRVRPAAYMSYTPLGLDLRTTAV